MKPFDKSFKGQINPATLKLSNNTMDLKVVWLVHYDFSQSKVQLSLFGAHSFMTTIGGHDFLKGFLWVERQTNHSNICLGGPGYNGIDRIFSSENTANKFLTYVRLNGFSIENKIVKPKRAPLQRISIAPKDDK